MPKAPWRCSLQQAVTVLGLLLAGLGLWQLGGAVWMHGKAVLAQVLLERAWGTTLDELVFRSKQRIPNRWI